MSGIASPWGLTNEMVAGLTPSLDFGDTHLTGQLGLTSIPPTFNNQGQLVSPLNVQQKSYYTHNFGKSFTKGKTSFQSFGTFKRKTLIKDINKDIKFLLKMF
jgi:hypothetical protein